MQRRRRGSRCSSGSPATRGARRAKEQRGAPGEGVVVLLHQPCAGAGTAQHLPPACGSGPAVGGASACREAAGSILRPCAAAGIQPAPGTAGRKQAVLCKYLGRGGGRGGVSLAARAVYYESSPGCMSAPARVDA
jgi:hypothetical protein